MAELRKMANEIRDNAQASLVQLVSLISDKKSHKT